MSMFSNQKHQIPVVFSGVSCVARRCIGHNDQVPGWEKILPVLPFIQTISGAHLVSYSTGNGSSFSWPYSSHRKRLTAHIHLLPRLKICGAIPPLLSHAFRTCTRTSSLLCHHEAPFVFPCSFLCSKKYIFSQLGSPVFDSSKSCSNFRLSLHII